MSREQGRRGWAALALMAGLALTSCGTPAQQATTPGTNAPPAGAPSVTDVIPVGDIPDTQVYIPFSPQAAGFTVSVPQGWAQSTTASATTFSDKFNSVRIDRSPMPTAPDPNSVRTQELPGLQHSVPGFALGQIQSVTRTAGTAVLVTYEGDSAANAVTGRSVREAVERYSFWHAGQEVVLTLSGPKGADNVDPWRKITDSLRWQA